jgi:hypothetical protein
MAASAAFPGLSDLLVWPTDHLTEGADYWQAVAARWYETFAQVWQDSLSVDWEGNAVKALHDRTYADKLRVSGLVDRLQGAATLARTGASDVDAARSGLRSAVQDARATGFEVGEGLSVTDRSTAAALRCGRSDRLRRKLLPPISAGALRISSRLIDKSLAKSPPHSLTSGR